MKKNIIIFVMLCSLYVSAGTIQEKFLQANAVYQEGQGSTSIGVI
jgi:hypothetical protein